MTSTYYKRKAAGVCTRCGARDSRTKAGMTLCLECARDRKEFQRYLDTFPEHKEHRRQTMYEAQIRRRAESLAAGLCPRCGTRPAEPGRVQCAYCNAYFRVYKRKHYQTKEEHTT